MLFFCFRLHLSLFFLRRKFNFKMKSYSFISFNRVTMMAPLMNIRKCENYILHEDRTYFYQSFSKITWLEEHVMFAHSSSFSSEPSPQSLSESHFHCSGIHRWLSHWNFRVAQTGVSPFLQYCKVGFTWRTCGMRKITIWALPYQHKFKIATTFFVHPLFQSGKWVKRLTFTSSSE